MVPLWPICLWVIHGWYAYGYNQKLMETNGGSEETLFGFRAVSNSAPTEALTSLPAQTLRKVLYFLYTVFPTQSPASTDTPPQPLLRPRPQYPSLSANSKSVIFYFSLWALLYIFLTLFSFFFPFFFFLSFSDQFCYVSQLTALLRREHDLSQSRGSREHKLCQSTVIIVIISQQTTKPTYDTELENYTSSLNTARYYNDSNYNCRFSEQLNDRWLRKS